MASKSHLKAKAHDARDLFNEVVDDYIVLQCAYKETEEKLAAAEAALEGSLTELQGAQLRTAAWIESFDALLDENHSLEKELDETADRVGALKGASSAVLCMVDALSYDNGFGLALVDPELGVFGDLRELVYPELAELTLPEADACGGSGDGCGEIDVMEALGGTVSNDVQFTSTLALAEWQSVFEDYFRELYGLLDPAPVAELLPLVEVEEPIKWVQVYGSDGWVWPVSSWQVDVAGCCTPGDECW